MTTTSASRVPVGASRKPSSPAGRGVGGRRARTSFDACLGVVAERRHHARVAVVAHEGGGAERLGELRDERHARPLEPVQHGEPAGAVERAEAARARQPLEREQRGAQRDPVARRRGGEPVVERGRGVGRGDRRERRLGRRGGVGERREDRRLARRDDRERGAARRVALWRASSQRLQQPLLLRARERRHRGPRRLAVARLDRRRDRVVAQLAGPLDDRAEEVEPLRGRRRGSSSRSARTPGCPRPRSRSP